MPRWAQRYVEDIFVIKEATTHNPVASEEAGQVRTDVSDISTIKVCDIEEVPTVDDYESGVSVSSSVNGQFSHLAQSGR